MQRSSRSHLLFIFPQVRLSRSRDLPHGLPGAGRHRAATNSAKPAVPSGRSSTEVAPNQSPRVELVHLRWVRSPCPHQPLTVHSGPLSRGCVWTGVQWYCTRTQHQLPRPPKACPGPDSPPDPVRQVRQSLKSLVTSPEHASHWDPSILTLSRSHRRLPPVPDSH